MRRDLQEAVAGAAEEEGEEEVVQEVEVPEKHTNLPHKAGSNVAETSYFLKRKSNYNANFTNSKCLSVEHH